MGVDNVIPMPDAGVPIIGEEYPAQIHELRTFVVAQCSCGREGAQPMLIDNIAQVGTCQGCGGRFVIASLLVTRQGKELRIEAQLARLRQPKIATPTPADVARLTAGN